MFSKFATRREFLNCGKLSLLFFLNSCSNIPNKVKIALQNSFYPESFKDTIPKDWKQEKINFENIRLQKNKNKIFSSDFTLINDGWISSIDFAEFEKINEYALIENLDKRSIDFLGSFNENQRSKLFPIGVVPYAIIIKNNKELVNLINEKYDVKLLCLASPLNFKSSKYKELKDYELGHVKEGVGAGGISLLAFLNGFNNDEIVSLCQQNLEIMKGLGQISLEKDC